MTCIPVLDVNNVNTKVQVWEYLLPGGCKVIAGKTDKDNDLVSLKLADPSDWWFHVRSLPGSHVVLKVDGDCIVNSESLRQAAAIAAYHSKARGGGMVSVSGTFAKYVTKPSGSRPGTVQICRERVFKVKPSIPSA